MPLGTKTWLYTKSIVKLERDEYVVYELLDGSHNIIDYLADARKYASKT